MGRERYTEGVEEAGNGKAYPPLQPIRESGSLVVDPHEHY